METLARPYARAIFDVAKEQGNATSWQDFLSMASKALKVPEFAAALEDPTKPIATKLSFFTDALKLIQDEEGMNQGANQSTDARLTNEQTNLLNILIEKRRVQIIPAIYSLFALMQKELNSEVQVRVTSAYELEADEKQKIADKISALSGKKAILTEQLDQSLIGGVIIEWDNKTLDSSIKGKLEKLTTAL